MAERKSYEELNKIKEELGIKTLWSFSRYDKYKTDMWEYKLNYIDHIKEDKMSSIYSPQGSACHDIIEGLYEGTYKYEQMYDEYETNLMALTLNDFKYASDSDRNKSIANKYEECVRHFFKNHKVITNRNEVEKFVLVKITDKIYFQGYIDFLHFDEERDERGNNVIKKVHVVDFKTSTLYRGNAIESHGKQLLLYSEAIHQLLGIPYEDIIPEWNFLKYTKVTYDQKKKDKDGNRVKKDRILERHKIGESLANTVKMWLKDTSDYDLGLTESDIDELLERVITENSLECLPKEVQARFSFDDAYVQVPLSEEIINELKNDIINTINEIEEKTAKYEQSVKDGNPDESLFWQEVTANDEFRLATLCGYSRKYHKPYDEYLKDKEIMNKTENEDNTSDDLDDFLSSIGFETENNTETTEIVSDSGMSDDELMAFLDSL